MVFVKIKIDHKTSYLIKCNSFLKGIDAITIYNQVLNKQQNAEHFLSHDFRLSPEDQVLFILSCASKRTQPDILLLVEFFNEVIINELLSLDLSENPEIVRKIRTINFLLNGDLPEWIFKHLLIIIIA